MGVDDKDRSSDCCTIDSLCNCKETPLRLQYHHSDKFLCTEARSRYGGHETLRVDADLRPEKNFVRVLHSSGRQRIN
jgi:hypothetical protein